MNSDRDQHERSGDESSHRTDGESSNRPAGDIDSAELESAATAMVRRRPPFRATRLILKELRETLRDRRTIITLVLMPLLVYPALSLVFKTFLLSSMAGMLPSDEPMVFQVAYASDGDKESANDAWTRLGDLFGRVNPSNVPDSKMFINPIASPDRHVWTYISRAEGESVADVVSAGHFDVGFNFVIDPDRIDGLKKIEMYVRNDSTSQVAADYFDRYFGQINDVSIRRRLQMAGISAEPLLEYVESAVGPAGKDRAQKSFPLASLIPLVLVLMTITGAVYPAIDLTAGERERGTLETLMAAPVPRFWILFSKFIAVWVVAVLTAFLNVIGMFATVWAFQLDRQFGESELFTLTVMGQILALLILFAAFFSALLLVVTSSAKSFKEAQVYLIPIILLSLGPGLMALSPGMSLAGFYSVTPMVNILLLARDVIQNQVMLVPAGLVILSTLLYTWLAIRVAAGIFGSDAILYSGSGTVADMFVRPAVVNRVVPLTATLFCLALLFPANFAAIGFVGRMPGESGPELEWRFLAMGLATFLAFMLLPSIVAIHQRTNFLTGFGLRFPRPVFFLAAVWLGVCLAPIAMSLLVGWHEVYGYFWGTEQSGEWHDRLIAVTQEHMKLLRQISPWVIAVSFSIVPAICEEWFFRGMLLRSLLKSHAAFKSILISAVVFSAFHMLSGSVISLERLIPTTMVGLVLGYLALKSGSVLPGVILHALNNAFVVFVPLYQPQLSERFAWFPGENEPLSLPWVVGGCAAAAIGAASGLALIRKAGANNDTIDRITEPGPDLVSEHMESETNEHVNETLDG